MVSSPDSVTFIVDVSVGVVSSGLVDKSIVVIGIV